MNHSILRISLRLLIVVSGIVLAVALTYYVSKVIFPFIIGFLIAYFINPLVNFFERKGRFPRSLAVLLSLFLIFTIFTSFIILLIVEIASGAEYLAKVVPDHLETFILYFQNVVASQLIPLYKEIANLFHRLESEQQITILNNFESAGSTIGTALGEFIRTFFSKIPNVLSWFPNAGTVLIFSILATFFISKDWERLKRKLEKYTPKQVQSSSYTVLYNLKKALFGFLKAQFTLISFTTIILLIGLLILRVDYAITIALVAGLIDIVPYLGTGIIFVPWIIYEAISGEVGLSIGLTILYMIVIIQRQMIEPKVISSNIGLDPLATLVSIFVGYKLFGFLGLIAGPVVLVIIISFHRADVFKNVWAFIKG